MKDDTTRKACDSPNRIPRWTEWLTLGLAASAWACVCLVIVTKLLEGAFISTWGRALRRSDIALVFGVGAPMFAFASLASYPALRWVRRHTWKNTAGLVLGSLFLVGIIIMAASNTGSGREGPRRSLCTSNLKQILYACNLCADDNAAAYPREFAALFGDYMSDSQLFICPTVAGEGHAPKRGSGRFIPEAVCYCYVSGLRRTDDEEFAVAFDEEWNHRGEGIVVARIGGQVEWVRDIEAFHAELEKQRAALAAEGRQMKIIRPTWSRWPERPEYLVRPWHERPGPVIGVVVLFIAMIGGAVALIVRQRRAAKRG